MEVHAARVPPDFPAEQLSKGKFKRWPRNPAKFADGGDSALPKRSRIKTANCAESIKSSLGRQLGQIPGFGTGGDDPNAARALHARRNSRRDLGFCGTNAHAYAGQLEYFELQSAKRSGEVALKV
jgi:hypothetical protein